MSPRTTHRQSSHTIWWLVLFALATTVIIPFTSSTQELARRLVLKDGSYQLIKTYEIKGDRVRYLSAERNEWEEIPASLVDWPATEKFRSQPTARHDDVQLQKDLDDERELEESSLPQVAPGLRLPEDSGVFLLDTYKGEPELVEMQQAEGDVNRNTKANILRGAINPIASVKQTIELQRQHAALQSHVGVPSIYIKIDTEQTPAEGHHDPPQDSREKLPNDSAPPSPQGPQQPQQPQLAAVPFDRFHIVRADIKSGKRIVGGVKRAVTGKVSQEQHLARTTIDRVKGGWLKITPTEALAPGEYAVVEMNGKEGMNLYVWDFGVNPNAPANPNPWKPEAKVTTKPPEKAADQPK